MPTIGKLYDSILLKRADPWFLEKMNPLQGANRSGCSSIETAMVLQEAISYHTERQSTAYVGLLDIKKAFDTVWLEGLFLKLHQEHMDPKLWRIVRNAYADFKCCVSVGGKQSDWFSPKQGVHQGDVMSMRLHSMYINNLVTSLQKSNRGAVIDGLACISPSFADDVAIIALSKGALSAHFGTALKYSQKWRFQLAPEKTFYMTFGRDREPTTEVTIGEQLVQKTEGLLHVGVPLCSTRTSENTIVTERIGSCRRKFYAATAATSPQTRLPPLTASRLYDAVCRTKMTYGAEVWSPADANMELLERQHSQFGRQIQGLSKTVGSPASYCLLGWLPVRAIFDVAKLLYIVRLLSLPLSSFYKRMAMYRLTDCRFGQCYTGPFAYAYRAAVKYNLQHAIHVMLDTGVVPTKLTWKRVVMEAVWTQQQQLWHMHTIMYRSLDLLRQCVDVTSRASVWWTVSRSNPQISRHCRLTVKMVCGDVVLNSLKGKYIHGTSKCMCCDSHEPETATHTLFVCPGLSVVRDTSWAAFKEHALPAQLREVDSMNLDQRLVFLLSGCKSQYVKEWQLMYEAIATFVFRVYGQRADMVTSMCG